MKVAKFFFAAALMSVGCGGSTQPLPESSFAPAKNASARHSQATSTGEIRAFSADEIRGLTEGRALRFGRAAEKNHNPAPYFLLKYKSELALFDEQTTPAKAILDRERAQASRLGKELVANQAKLEAMLANVGGAREDEVANLVREGARLVAEIQLVHIQADVAAKKLLNPGQQVQYESIRSYDPDEDGRDAQDRDGNCSVGP